MQVTIQGCRITLAIGDITNQFVDAIVNAANKSLLGGGGVDGAVHRVAGPLLLEACRDIRKGQLKGRYLPTGIPVLTAGFHLPARYVIHVVGPICGVDADVSIHLRNAYFNSLKLASMHNFQSIAFPSISTGAFGCEVHWAADVALRAVVEFLERHQFEEVRFVLFSREDYQIYTETFQNLLSNP
jgi:O-acetyl-ADP-ribose deacetylase (regulator of RNase III)